MNTILPSNFSVVNNKCLFENFKRVKSDALKSDLKIRMLIIPKKRGKKKYIISNFSGKKNLNIEIHKIVVINTTIIVLKINCLNDIPRLISYFY